MSNVIDWSSGEKVTRPETDEEIVERSNSIKADFLNTKCSRTQGILALGQDRWTTIQAYKATATWGEQVVIDSSSTWNRDSQNVAFFAYLLGLTDTQVDDLFKLAITIEV